MTIITLLLGRSQSQDKSVDAFRGSCSIVI
jgi:hypothetical protein